MLVSSYITPKARKGVSSAIEGRGLVAVAPIAADELVAIKGGTSSPPQPCGPCRNACGTPRSRSPAAFTWPPQRTQSTSRSRSSSIIPASRMWGFAGDIVLVAMRDISPGEELTTDYALFDDYGMMQCHCATPSCRGTIGGRDWQRPDVQRKYGSYFSSYLLYRLARQPDRPR